MTMDIVLPPYLPKGEQGEGGTGHSTRKGSKGCYGKRSKPHHHAPAIIPDIPTPPDSPPDSPPDLQSNDMSSFNYPNEMFDSCSQSRDSLDYESLESSHDRDVENRERYQKSTKREIEEYAKSSVDFNYDMSDQMPTNIENDCLQPSLNVIYSPCSAHRIYDFNYNARTNSDDMQEMPDLIATGVDKVSFNRLNVQLDDGIPVNVERNDAISVIVERNDAIPVNVERDDANPDDEVEQVEESKVLLCQFNDDYVYTDEDCINKREMFGSFIKGREGFLATEEQEKLITESVKSLCMGNLDIFKNMNVFDKLDVKEQNEEVNLKLINEVAFIKDMEEIPKKRSIPPPVKRNRFLSFKNGSLGRILPKYGQAFLSLQKTDLVITPLRPRRGGFRRARKFSSDIDGSPDVSDNSMDASGPKDSYNPYNDHSYHTSAKAEATPSSDVQMESAVPVDSEESTDSDTSDDQKEIDVVTFRARKQLQYSQQLWQQASLTLKQEKPKPVKRLAKKTAAARKRTRKAKAAPKKVNEDATVVARRSLPSNPSPQVVRKLQIEVNKATKAAAAPEAEAATTGRGRKRKAAEPKGAINKMMHVVMPPEVASGKGTKLTMRISTSCSNSDGGEDVCKRQEHNNLERKRRYNMKELLQELRVLVPHVAHNEKASKLLILRETLSYVKGMEDKDEVLIHQIDQETLRNEQLMMRLRSLQQPRQLNGGLRRPYSRK